MPRGQINSLCWFWTWGKMTAQEQDHKNHYIYICPKLSFTFSSFIFNHMPNKPCAAWEHWKWQLKDGFFFSLRDVRNKSEPMSLPVYFLEKKLLFFTNMDSLDKAMSPKGKQVLTGWVKSSCFNILNELLKATWGLCEDSYIFASVSFQRYSIGIPFQ